MSEDIFWNKSVAFVKGVALNDSAFNEWLNYQVEKERRTNGK